MFALKAAKYKGLLIYTRQCLILMVLGVCNANDSSNFTKGLMQSLMDGHLNIGMRNDYRLQDCYGTSFKQTFPDIDYSFLGYNMFYGYPLTDGVDPGFTLPIFATDYSVGLQSSDCVYSIPKGLVVLPTVSCRMSFKSDIVKTTREFSKSIAASTSGSGLLEEFSFSGNIGFQESTSAFSFSESVKIISTAKCKYYITKLQTNNPPKFTDAFISMVNQIQHSNKREIYFEFFDTFGTHFPVSIIFGAKLIYDHRMKTSEYKKKVAMKEDIANQASLLSLFSAGLQLTANQRSESSKLEKHVTTTTISVGGTPPVFGGVTSWASIVQEHPVPIEYKLEPIISLFTEKYMSQMNVNFTFISNNIKMFEHDYCRYLYQNSKVDGCSKTISPELHIPDTIFQGKILKELILPLNIENCTQKCREVRECVAISFSYLVKVNNYYRSFCFLYGTFGKIITQKRSKVILFPAKLKRFGDYGDISDAVLNNTLIPEATIIGIGRELWETDNITSSSECAAKCTEDTVCIAYSYCTCPEKISRCRIFAEDKIKGIKSEKGTTVGFVW